MITIYFTQCDKDFKHDDFCEEMALWPIIPRCQKYEEVLLEVEADGNGIFFTLDEHFILIAQYLKRHGKIEDLTLVSVCSCRLADMPTKDITILTDDEGDFTESPHHGFFIQRLPYLR